jgi:hypothetical protein
MSDDKIYKKGTKVWLCCATHDAQSKEFEEYTLEADMTETELSDVAKEYFYLLGCVHIRIVNTKEPECWFTEEEPERD